MAANQGGQFVRVAPLYHRGAQGGSRDQLRSPDRNLDARQGQVISFGILNILVLISTILKGLPQRRLVAAFKGTSFAPETETSQKDDSEVALDAARCAAADSKSAA